MNAIINAAPAVDQADVGLYRKFNVTRTDGSSEPGGRHEYDQYFVLELTDKHAIPALASYAQSCADEYPLLASDLRAIVMNAASAGSEFVTIPDTTLPDGTVVPAFEVARYLSSKGAAGIPVSIAAATPWVEINYNDARKACSDAGLKLITETQALAIAWNIYHQDANWTGGKVGEGSLYQGLRKETVEEAQPATYESEDPDERRWHVLSTGERIYDFAGNAYTWIFDDVQGDENGICAKAFASDSISITTPPHPSMEKGLGWYPDATFDWSGGALVRGGCWGSGASAGVFFLRDDWPGRRYDRVGFRCTK